MNNLLQKLLLGGSTAALVSTAWAGIALAQNVAANDQTIETVTVTGTNIRGIAPIGENLMTVTADDFKAVGAVDTQSVLASVPALMSFGAVGQGQTGSGASQPAIHSLGSSGTNSTLVLFDGHRMVTGGTNHSEPDPGFLPLNMIERVEVLADGASSTYGSDAIAGVVNFITRNKFEGVQLGASGSIADGKSDNEYDILVGKDWGDGSAMVAFTAAHQGLLLNIHRPYTAPNHLAQGIIVPGAPPNYPSVAATNFNNFNCAPATIQPGGAGNIYTSATSGVSLANSAANGPCNQWQYGALVPDTDRDNGMIKLRENFGPKLTVTADIILSTRHNSMPISAGTLTATAFSTGPQANPFYQNPVGYTGTATSEQIRLDANQLIGPGNSINGSDTQHGDFTAEYRFGDKDGTPFQDVVFDFLATVGHDDSYSYQNQLLNSAVASLALNGTINTSGSLTSPVPNTAYTVTALPLTTATALDVWNPLATNRTSSAVRLALDDQDRALVNAQSGRGRAVSGVDQFRGSLNGTILTLPAGPVKAALGAEYVRYQLWENAFASNGAGAGYLGATDQVWNFRRNVYSFYGELVIPVISPEMNIPLVENFTLDVSGRYDHYSDFGATQNPKFGFDWKVFNDLKVRADISTSFVAPPVDVVGDQYGASDIASLAGVTNNLSVPVAIFPQVTQFNIAGCTSASTSCNISSLQGVQVMTGCHLDVPAKGRGWTVGFDYTPSDNFLDGLTVSATYWRAEILGASQSPTIGYSVNSAGEAHLLTFYPNGGASAATLASFSQGILATAALPTKIDYIFDSVDSAFVSLKEEGIDASIEYKYDFGDIGIARAGTEFSILTKGYESLAGSDWYHLLNTSGLNNNNSTIAVQTRTHVGWDLGNLTGQLFMNYTGGYRNLGANAANPIINCTAACGPNAIGNIIGGGDTVKANITFDVYAGYSLDTGLLGMETQDEISLTIRNLFDQKPPYVNASSPIDRNANPLGRVFTLKLQMKM